MPTLPALLPSALVCALTVGAALANPDVQIPEELLDDPHFRSEFGLNDLTTPSIRRVFIVVKGLGPLPPHLLPPTSTSTFRLPVDRAELALSLGSLIADGFFLVEARKAPALETLAERVHAHCTALGTGQRVIRHAKALLDSAAAGSWEALEHELAATQREVEAELIALRDVDAVQLISFGGWIRAFDLATALLEADYSPVRADLLLRLDVVEYYLDSLQYLEPGLQERPSMRTLQTHLDELMPALSGTGEEVGLEEVRTLRRHALALSAAAFPPR